MREAGREQRHSGSGRTVREFGGLRAVDQVTFSVDKGQVLGFIGPNGAGKTTTMRILATLDQPQHGDARIDGVSVVEYPEEARRRTGFMPDYAGVYVSTTVSEYLIFSRAATPFAVRTVRGPSTGSSVSWESGTFGTGLWTSLKGTAAACGAGPGDHSQSAIADSGRACRKSDPRARIEFRTLI